MHGEKMDCSKPYSSHVGKSTMASCTLNLKASSETPGHTRYQNTFPWKPVFLESYSGRNTFPTHCGELVGGAGGGGV